MAAESAAAVESANSRKSFINYMVWLGTGVFDYLNTSAIYIGYLTPTLMQLFLKSLQFIFFPIYAINTAIYAGTALVNMLLDRDKDTKKIKTSNIIRFVINTLSMLLVAIAVLGSLIFPGIYTTLLFAGNLALTGVYQFAGAGYNLYQHAKKGRELNNPELDQTQRAKLTDERSSHKGTAISHFAVGFTILLVALAGALAVLGGMLPFASLGIVAGILGAAFCIYGIVDGVGQKVADDKKKKAYGESKKHDGESADDSLLGKPKPPNTVSILKGLGRDILGPDRKVAFPEEKKVVTGNESAVETAKNDVPLVNLDQYRPASPKQF